MVELKCCLWFTDHFFRTLSSLSSGSVTPVAHGKMCILQVHASVETKQDSASVKPGGDLCTHCVSQLSVIMMDSSQRQSQGENAFFGPQVLGL